MGAGNGRTLPPTLLSPPSWSHGAYPARETDKEALADVLVSEAEPKPG